MRKKVSTKYAYYSLLVSIINQIPPELAFKKMETGTKKYYKWSDADVRDMQTFRDQGKTYKEIGEIYGITDQAVFKIIKRRAKDGN